MEMVTSSNNLDRKLFRDWLVRNSLIRIINCIELSSIGTNGRQRNPVMKGLACINKSP